MGTEDKTIGRSFFFDISGIGNRNIGNGNSNTTMQIVGDKRKIGICTWIKQWEPTPKM
jgi:hypothetical protein